MMKIEKKQGGFTLLSAQEYEALTDKADVVGKYVTKEDFFALTSLASMSAEGAAEATYQRWLMAKRVVETREVIQDPTGLTEDKVTVLIEARYINSERRRENANKRQVEESRKVLLSSLPAALR